MSEPVGSHRWLGLLIAGEGCPWLWVSTLPCSSEPVCREKKGQAPPGPPGVIGDLAGRDGGRVDKLFPELRYNSPELRCTVAPRMLCVVGAAPAAWEDRKVAPSRCMLTTPRCACTHHVGPPEKGLLLLCGSTLAWRWMAMASGVASSVPSELHLLLATPRCACTHHVGPPEKGLLLLCGSALAWRCMAVASGMASSVLSELHLLLAMPRCTCTHHVGPSEKGLLLLCGSALTWRWMAVASGVASSVPSELHLLLGRIGWPWPRAACSVPSELHLLLGRIGRPRLLAACSPCLSACARTMLGRRRKGCCSSVAWRSLGDGWSWPQALSLPCSSEPVCQEKKEPGVAESEFAKIANTIVFKQFFPPWLSEQDIASLDKNWELIAAWTGAKVEVPVKFTVGKNDLSYNLPGVQDYIHKGGFKKDVTLLKDAVIMEGICHIINQKSPQEDTDYIYNIIKDF